MTTRNLEGLFRPKSIALLGASNEPGSLGAVLARNLLESGFSGPVLPVNPHETTIRSTLSYRSVADLPVAPDLAVIATPAPTVPQIVADLGARGCKAAVVISAGFGAEAGGLGEQLLKAARPHLLRIVGPNCLGFISPGIGLNASFAQLTPKAGGVALVAQSGAVTTAALDWAEARGFGFSHVVTLGDALDVDFGDLLDYLALDPQTHAIVLYVESVSQARKFMSAGRIASRAKPVVVIKAGRSTGGARAAFSHTGALAGSDAVYDAAFRRAGMLRVDNLRQLFDAVATLTAGLAVRGDRLAILTNGGGVGVLAADALEAEGGRLAEISSAGSEKLKIALPAHASPGNPVDVLGDAGPERYRAGLDILLEEPEIDGILVLTCPTALTDGAGAARAVIAACEAHPDRRPVISCWLGERSAAEGRRLLSSAGLPTYETPDEAVQAFMQLARHDQNRRQLMQAPGSAEGAVDRVAARKVIEQTLSQGRSILTDPEARAVLAAYGVPTIESRIAQTPAESAAVASAMAAPMALKILSPDISHKSDVGGVALNLPAAAVEVAAQEMLAAVKAAAPVARIEGFVIEPMTVRPLGEELIAGIVRDKVFGPAVLFGSGGVSTEIECDRSVGLVPLDEVLARDMIARTRVARRLAGYRNRPTADIGAIAAVLVALARLAIDIPEIAELDVNPLLADDKGVVALDARISLGPAGLAAAPAICAYPDGLSRTVAIQAGDVTIRAIRPADAPGLIAMIDKSTPEDVRLRFCGGMRHLPDAWAQRLSQIDYDREMALVAEEAEGDLLGVARLAADPEGENAEFALMVRNDWQGRGLGRALLAALLDHAQARGLATIWGDIARDNHNMLEMAGAFGFATAPSEDMTRVRVVRSLS